MMIKFFCILLFQLPIIALAQPQDISGIWRLKEKKSINGLHYNNGIPSLIRIDKNGETLKIEMVSSVQDRDSSELQFVSLDGTPTENITSSNRKKIIYIHWNKSTKEWTKYTKLSAKDEFAITDISIVDLMKVSNTGTELILTRDCDISKPTVMRADYRMQGIYEKITEEDLAAEISKGKGIQFTEGLTWKQIIDKARKERKMIFIDCYATWCMPCKKMDKEVFDLNIIGKVMNDNFLSIKVQMDTSKNDNNKIKLTYPIARYLEKEYKINALPTYLFFNEDGLVVHKAKGAFSRKDFLILIKTAMDSTQQIYTLIRKAEAGETQNAEVAALANSLQQISEKELAFRVARLYIDRYLNKLNEYEFLSKENIEFVSRFRGIVTTSDFIFKVIMKMPSTVDSVLGKVGFASGFVDAVITTNHLQPALNRAKKNGLIPDWKALATSIEKEFGKIYADRTITNAKVIYYKNQKMWMPFTKSLEHQMELIGDLNALHWISLNSAAWNMFEHSNDKQQLEKALRWSELAIEKHSADKTIKDAPWGSVLDTYANLLYKLGRREDAVQYYQNRILNVCRVQSIRLYDRYVKIFKGIPTWEDDIKK